MSLRKTGTTTRCKVTKDDTGLPVCVCVVMCVMCHVCCHVCYHHVRDDASSCVCYHASHHHHATYHHHARASRSIRTQQAHDRQHASKAHDSGSMLNKRCLQTPRPNRKHAREPGRPKTSSGGAVSECVMVAKVRGLPGFIKTRPK